MYNIKKHRLDVKTFLFNNISKYSLITCTAFKTSIKINGCFLNIDNPIHFSVLSMHKYISMTLSEQPEMHFWVTIHPKKSLVFNISAASACTIWVMIGFVICMLRMKPWQISLGDGFTGHSERYSLHFDWGKAVFVCDTFICQGVCVCSLLLSRGVEAVPQGLCFSGAWGPTVNLQTI